MGDRLHNDYIVTYYHLWKKNLALKKMYYNTWWWSFSIRQRNFKCKINFKCKGSRFHFSFSFSFALSASFSNKLWLVVEKIQVTAFHEWKSVHLSPWSNSPKEKHINVTSVVINEILAQNRTSLLKSLFVITFEMKWVCCKRHLSEVSTSVGAFTFAIKKASNAIAFIQKKHLLLIFFLSSLSWKIPGRKFNLPST